MYFFFILAAIFGFAQDSNYVISVKRLGDIDIQPNSINVTGFQIRYTIPAKSFTFNNPQLLLTVMTLEDYDESQPLEDMFTMGQNSIIHPRSMPTVNGHHIVDIAANLTCGETYLVWIAFGQSGSMTVFGPGRFSVDTCAPTGAPSIFAHDLIDRRVENGMCRERQIFNDWMTRDQCWEQCLDDDTCLGCVYNADVESETCNSEGCFDNNAKFAPFHRCQEISRNDGSFIEYRRLSPTTTPTTSPTTAPTHEPCNQFQTHMQCEIGEDSEREELRLERVDYCEIACNDHTDGRDYCCEYNTVGSYPTCTMYYGSTAIVNSPKPEKHYAMINTGSNSLRVGYECDRRSEGSSLEISSSNVCHHLCSDTAAAIDRIRHTNQGCCQYEPASGLCAFYPGTHPISAPESSNHATLCDPFLTETPFPTPAILSPGQLGTTQVPVFEEFWCSNHTCYWNDGMRGIEWDYYTRHPLDCETCSEICRQDPNCGGVECDTYCAWWAVGVCENPADWSGLHPTCRRKSDFNHVGMGLCSPNSPITVDSRVETVDGETFIIDSNWFNPRNDIDDATFEKVDSIDACFLACKATKGCSGVNVATVGETMCQAMHDVPTGTTQYDFDWFRQARIQCYARGGDPSSWLIPSPAPTIAELYVGTPHPTPIPTQFPTNTPSHYVGELKEWWDLKVILDVENVRESMQCENLKHVIWNAAMVIFVELRVKQEDISIEGCNMRRRSLQSLQITQRMPLRIRAYDYDIKNTVKVKLESPYLREYINTNIHPLRVTSVSDPVIYHFARPEPEPEPLSQQWRMILFLLFGVLAGTTCFACYLWLCIKRRLYRRIRRQIRRWQIDRRRARRTRRASSELSRPSQERVPPPIENVAPVVDEIAIHGGSDFSEEEDEMGSFSETGIEMEMTDVGSDPENEFREANPTLVDEDAAEDVKADDDDDIDPSIEVNLSLDDDMNQRVDS